MSLADLKGKTIAIPGELTTAFLALQLCIGKGGEAFKPVVVHFDEIPEYVKDGKADAGLIIHEGQLTYKQFGLHLVVDLGGGGTSRPACRCRWAATASARIWGRR